MVSYEKFYILIKQKKLTTYRIVKDGMINSATLSSLRNNRSVSLYTIEQLCKALECRPEQIIEVKVEKSEHEKLSRKEKIEFMEVAIKRYKQLYLETQKEYYYEQAIEWELCKMEYLNGKPYRFNDKYDRLIFNNEVEYA